MPVTVNHGGMVDKFNLNTSSMTSESLCARQKLNGFKKKIL